MKKLLIFFSLSLCVAQVGIAQVASDQESNKKPKASQVILIQKADTAFEAKDYKAAVAAYTEALDLSTGKRGFAKEEYLRINSNLAAANSAIGNPLNAIANYQVLVHTDIHPTAETLIAYGRALLAINRFTDAKEQLEEALKVSPQNPAAIKLMGVCDRAIAGEMITASVLVKSLAFNTKLDEFAPAYYGDGLLFASARNGRKKAAKCCSSHSPDIISSPTDIYLAVPGADGQMSRVEKFGKGINTKLNQGTAAVTSDMKFVYYTTAMKTFSKKDAKTYGNTLVIAKHDLATGKGELLSFSSSEFNCAHPALSADGHTLYFASDMPGGLGGMDLYRISLLDSDQEPLNLGTNVNTSGNEVFPFVSANDELYFASDIHPGLGGLDMFISIRNREGTYGKPVNLKAPYNSGVDDFGYISSETGETGYFNSKRNGSDDIFSFSRHGTFLMVYAEESVYAEELALLNPEEEKETVHPEFENILFQNDKWVIQPEARVTLDKLMEYMIANPKVRIEFSAFTDSNGLELYNLGLSVKRADAAGKYLGNKGVSGDRITNKFYGSEVLAAHCKDNPECIEEAHKQNRRIEISVIGD